MICYDCDAKAVVAYERHLENGNCEVTGYCKEHDPHPDQPYDTPFDPSEKTATEESRVV